MSKHPRAVPLDQLRDKIVDLLIDSRFTSGELAAITGCSNFAVRARLRELFDLGLAHRTGEVSENGRGLRYFWQYGAGPAVAPKKRISNKPSVDEPRQRAVTKYPKIGRRDDLVAAFFGPARKEAA